MTEHKGACCSSPATMCYWFAASVIAWGVLSLIGLYWRALHALSAATILFAMAIGCVANWFRNRTLHCGITGATILDRCRPAPAFRREYGSRQQSFGLAIRSHRGRHCVSTGMALRAAFRIVAVRM